MSGVSALTAVCLVALVLLWRMGKWADAIPGER